MKTEKLKPRLREIIRPIERRMILEAIEKHGSRTAAAAALDVSMQHIRRKLGAVLSH